MVYWDWDWIGARIDLIMAIVASSIEPTRRIYYG